MLLRKTNPVALGKREGNGKRGHLAPRAEQPREMRGKGLEMLPWCPAETAVQVWTARWTPRGAHRPSEKREERVS